MAEITGPIRFKGSMGDLRCYWNSAAKKWVVGKKGGANKNQIMHSPVFVRTRENINEIKGCGLWCKSFRLGLLKLDHLNYGYYMAEVVKVAKVIQTMDGINEHGVRLIETSKHKSLLTEINFNEQHPFKRVLMRTPEVIADDDRKSVTVNISQFNPRQELVWRQKGYIFRFALTISQLSDYYYDEISKKYRPVHPSLELNSRVVYGEWLSGGSEDENISLTASFPETGIPPSGVTVLVGLGIEFGTQMSGNTVQFSKGDGTMALIDCL